MNGGAAGANTAVSAILDQVYTTMDLPCIVWYSGNAADSGFLADSNRPTLARIFMKPLRILVCVGGVGLVLTMAGAASREPKPVRAVMDPGVVVTRQNITPAGVQSVFEGRVYGVAFGPTSDEVWALGVKDLIGLNWRENRVFATLPIEGKPGLQGVATDGAGRVYVASGSTSDVRLQTIAEGKPHLVAAKLGAFTPGTIGLSHPQVGGGSRRAVIPIIAENTAAVVDLESGKSLGSVPTGVAPVGAVVNRAGTIAYVSNWGGRLPKAGDKTAGFGRAKKAAQMVPAVITDRGFAATGTVTKVNLETLKSIGEIYVELHPVALAWDEARQRLYVANGNSDSVSVIDTRTDQVVQTFALQPFGAAARGVAPTALALTADGATLFVACGGINAVAKVRASDGVTEGLIPTGWYPNGLALSGDGKLLAVSTLLGVGSGWRDDFFKRFVHAYRGTVHVLAIPEAAQLASYTTAVAQNNHLPLAPLSPAPTMAPPVVMTKPAAIAIPLRSGEPSLIEHTVYIVKENRTYDQVFGDMKKGNGDASLVMFGEDVTTNQHRLADQFVLLDNFYASGGNSGDGHQWITQANETPYAMWPGWDGRSYPYDGTDPIAISSAGCLWDYALAAKKSVQVFGEYAPSTGAGAGMTRAKLFARWRAGDAFKNEWQIKSPIPSLDAVLVRNYPSYSLEVPDVVRARIFIAEIKQWEAAGKMPNVVLMDLPCNHTSGTRPGGNTPKAMVADNDLALGQIVEALSHSSFWKKMAIFVVEDDAQNGVDHVDGHRTVALAVSPYVRRGHIDSTFYAFPSVSKTIELVHGLPTMSLFDMIANDMRASFTDQPDFTPYTSVVPKQSIDEVNAQAGLLKGDARKAALASVKMNFEVPDAAPTEKLNRILWHDVRGWDVPYPGVKVAAFAPLTLDVDDDDR